MNLRLEWIAPVILCLMSACQPLPTVSIPTHLQEVQMLQAPSDLPFRMNVVLLEAYEDQTAPPGTQPGRDRAVAHAVIRLRLENLTQTPVNLAIDNVAIALEGRQTDMTQAVGNLELGGLQIVERGFHLTQPQGFGDVSHVQAVVTYRYSHNTYSTLSLPVQVIVNP